MKPSGLLVPFVALAAAAPLVAPSVATAGYGVQPNGQTIAVETDSLGYISSPDSIGILVYLDSADSDPYVFVSETPAITSYGTPAGTGVGSCGRYDLTAWTEPNKFVCSVSTILMKPDRTYYWWLDFDRVDPGNVFPTSHISGPFSFTLTRAATPPSTPPATTPPATSPPATTPPATTPPASRPAAKPDGHALPSVSGPSPASRRDPFYTAVAKKITGGKTTDVYCWDGGDWPVVSDDNWSSGEMKFGFVDPKRPHEVNLSPSVCARLDMIHYQHRNVGATYWIATAVDTLAHESIHTAGIRDEAVTECFAMQLTPYTAELLGKSYTFGRALASTLWRHYQTNLPAYKSPDCRDGGGLDLFPETHLWP